MKIISTGIEGVFLVQLLPREDERGYFMRTYDCTIFAQLGLQTDWVQENQSLSVFSGTVRGLHFQRGAAAETKLVRVLAGAILDVAVDVRKNSPTYGRHVAAELSARNNTALYIPRGFAHGFCTMESDSIVSYKVDNPYTPELEGGLLWCDESLEIAWPLTDAPACLSDKDALWPCLDELEPVDLSETRLK